jgi:hypothetical protein
VSDFRICAFCKRGDWVWSGSIRNLFHYSTRRYAHAWCLLDAKGTQKEFVKLPTFVIRDLPHRELKARGLLATAQEILGNEYQAREAAKRMPP